MAVKQQLEAMFRCALAAVHGKKVVHQALVEQPLEGPVSVVAIGKAADAMLSGALEVLGEQLGRALLISKPGFISQAMQDDGRISCLYGGHPLPDAGSLAAGERLLSFIDNTSPGHQLLFLFSGGCSSLVEVLRRDIELPALQRVNQWLLGSGLDIDSMNVVRRALSLIKGGRLLHRLGNHDARVLLISDVPNDAPEVIGSGLLFTPPAKTSGMPRLPGWLQQLVDGALAHEQPGKPVEHRVIATLDMALVAAAECGRALGYPVRIMADRLSGAAQAAAGEIAGFLSSAQPGAYLWGGETGVELPDNPGRGGRNQQFALSAAVALADCPVCLLAAGTDGNDGMTDAAGAIIDGGTAGRIAAQGLDAAACLQAADAGSCLAVSGDLLETGPTGTNVMDMVIGLKLPDG
jgi:hydroxypyruvate reductase